MKVGVLFSGGKDSCYAAYLAKDAGYKISCLISILSENKESYMFHTPSIEKVKVQADVMGIPLIIIKTKGVKEKELNDLESAIKLAVKKYSVEGIVTGAVESVYQATRVQKICNKLKLEVFNPLWQKDQFELLDDLLKARFEIIVVGVFAYPLDKKWLGKIIDKTFVSEISKLNKKWGIHVAGEGGEFESFVVNCPLYSRALKVKSFEDLGAGNSWSREVEVG